MISDCRQKKVVNPLILKGIFLLILLSGCAAAPIAPHSGLIFRVSGKFGIQDAQTGYSAQFDWRHYPHGYAIEVWGPLGQGRTLLRGNGERMEVRRGDEVLAEGLPESVMQAHLGWSVPIEVLPAWIQGFPATRMEYGDALLDEDGRYTDFSQAGWQVALQRYKHRGKAGGELFTPGRIIAHHAARKVTVVVRDYAH